MFRSPKSKEKKKNVETKLLTEFLKSPQEFQTKEKFKPIFNSYSKSGSQFLTETETLGFLSYHFNLYSSDSTSRFYFIQFPLILHRFHSRYFTMFRKIRETKKKYSKATKSESRLGKNIT